MTHREIFEQMIKDDPHDSATRLVFADWLDEHNFPDAAAEQRRCTTPAWIEASKWLHQLCEDYNSPSDDPYPDYRITYTRLLELGLEACGQAEDLDPDNRDMLFGFSCHNNEDMCNVLRANREEFWKNWSIVTGINLPDYIDIKEQSSFSCSC